jgi:hypothetical protein
VSPHLQADIDHYVQRRRLIDEKERTEKMKAAEEEQKRKERLVKASAKGHVFSEMMERQRIMQQEKEHKLAKLKQTELDQQAEDKLKRVKAKQFNDELMASALKGSASWQEIQDLEEAKRRERIETRKQELLLMSALPPALAASQERQKRPNREVSQEPTASKARAEEPEHVARRLERQQQNWAHRLEQHKEKLKEQFMTRRSQSGTLSAGGSMVKTSMELRAERSHSRRNARIQAQHEKEQQDRQERSRRDKAKTELLLNMKLPASSLKATKAAKMREDKIKTELLDRELEIQREKRMMDKKKIKLKEAAVVLKSVIKDREEDLRSRNPGMKVELSASEHDAARRSAEAREAYRAKLRENKMKLNEAMRNRPSLLDRHDQSVAQRAAGAQALKTLTQAIMHRGDDDMDDFEAMLGQKSNSASRKSSGKSHKSANATMEAILQDDDIFDAKEKIIVKSILGK